MIFHVHYNCSGRLRLTLYLQALPCFLGSILKRRINTAIRMTKWGRIEVPRTEVELKTVLACGQSFRWKPNPNPDVTEESEWIGVFAHHFWILKQDEEVLYYKAYKNGKLQKPGKSYESHLRQYFQLDISLAKLYKEWASKDSKFAELTLTDYQGIRMLKQDPIETIFAFICSSNNNISRIIQMVEKLCLFYGEEIINFNGKTYFDFPKIENLVGNEVEKKLRSEGFGYRAGFIEKSAASILAKGGEKWVETLKTMEYDDARKELQSLVGVGRKVADCICLMALGFHECIPIDTHMHQVGKQYLPHLSAVKTLTDKVYNEISEYFRGIHGDYAGWAHSVLFTSTLRHLKASPAVVTKKRVPAAKAESPKKNPSKRKKN